jgi:hypothetical protein
MRLFIVVRDQLTAASGCIGLFHSCTLPRVNDILLILIHLGFIHLGLIHLPNLVLIAPTKRLSYLDPANAYCCVTVAQRVQLNA